jgi:hypothetical protein
VKLMEDHRGKVEVIAVGHTDEMAGFLAANPGLSSRFSRQVVFDNYTANDLVTISASTPSRPARPPTTCGRSFPMTPPRSSPAWPRARVERWPAMRHPLPALAATTATLITPWLVSCCYRSYGEVTLS